MADLGELIGAVARALGCPRPGEHRAGARQAGACRAGAPFDPRGSPRLSGLRQAAQIVQRHLAVAHQLTPTAYRERFGLMPDYPMTAPGYSRQRSEMARRAGLGQTAQPTPRTQEPRSGT